MATILQLRRGTTVQHSTFTGAIGEVTVDTTKQTIVVHDGQTQGGFALASEADVAGMLTSDDLIAGFGLTLSGTEYAVDTDTIATQAWVTTQIQSKDSLSELSGTSDDISEGSTNLFFTDARAQGAISVVDNGGDGSLSYASGVITYTGPSAAQARAHFSAGSGVTLTDGEISVGQDVSPASSPTFAGLTLTGDASVSADIIPSVDNTYSLGSPDFMWKDVYIGPGSLYINGQKVLEETSGNIIVSADIGQNLVLQTAGSGDIELDPTGDGVVSIKGPLQLQSGENITSSSGDPITFSSGIISDSVASKTANGNLVLSGNGTGSVTVADNLNITGDLTVSGTTTTVNSETISLADNIIDLNSNFTTGNPTENAGIKIKRGDEADVQLRWNETTDKWQYTNDGAVYYDIGAADLASFGITATAAELNYVDGVTSSIQTQLDGKAATSHSHVISDVTNLQSELDGKAASAHTHVIADVTGLQGELDGKAAIGHSHVIADVTGLQGELDDLQTAIDGKAAIGHSHVIADVTGLQGELDSKLDSSGYTAADVLTKIKTVDGTGSGLDADLLDGQQATYFATAASVTAESAARVSGDSTTLSSAQSYTDNAIANLVNGADAAFDTLKEIQDAMATDAELSSAISSLTIGDGTQTITAGDYMTGGGDFTANQTADSSVTLSVDATSDNIASKVVARDASGNFTAGTITANLTGNVTGNVSGSAGSVEWANVGSKPSPTITLAGDLSGSVTLTDVGSGTLTATIAANSVALGTDTTGNYVAGATAGNYITVSGTAGEGWSPTIAVDATSANTASKVVARDASGNFAAGTITASLSGNASTATSAGKWTTARSITLGGDLSGSVSLDGSSNVTLTATVADDSHNHVISNVDGLQDALDAKSDATHNHTLDSLSNVTVTSIASGEILKWNGTAWVNNTATEAGIATETYVDTAINNLVNGADAAFDTLKEIQDAMATDAELSAAISGLTIGDGTQTITAGEYATGGGSFTANQTGNTSVTIGVDATSANTASKVVARDASGNFSAGTITANLTGNVTGNASTATSAGKWTTARSITLGGDLSGSVSIDGSANVTLTATVADDSHNHVISNVDGLQAALDAKSDTTHNHTLDGLSNVTVTSIAAGELLKWDGNAWINNTLAEAGIAATSHNHTIASLTDTTISSIASGEILKWNGTAWINNTLAEAGILAASSYTAADVLAKIKTVDGAGSGLDADLLDGQSSAYYATAASVTANRIDIYDETGTLLN